MLFLLLTLALPWGAQAAAETSAGLGAPAAEMDYVKPEPADDNPSAGPALRPEGESSAAGPERSRRGPLRIAEVRFVGFDNLSPSSASEVMETKVPSFLSLEEKQVLDRSRLERDCRRLVSLYKEQGFFQAEVVYSLERREREATVFFTAHEMDPTLVENVTLHFAHPEDQRWEEGLRGLIGPALRPGAVFTLSAYEALKDDASYYLADNGHPQNRVEGRVLIYPEELKARLEILLDPGPPYTFGPTTVKGESNIDESYIIRQLRYAPGQSFSQSLLESSQQAIFDTNFFSTVVAAPKFEESQNGAVPVEVEVREASRHSLRLGLGWGTEDGFRVRLLQINRDLLRLNETITFTGKISNIYQGLTGRMSVPYLFNRRSSFLMNGGLEQADWEAYHESRLFITPMARYNLMDRWSTALGWNWESNRVDEVKTQGLDKSFEQEKWFISSLLADLSFDNRDSSLDPHQGAAAGLQVEFSLPGFGSDLSFVRPVVQASQVLPLFWDNWHVAGRIKAGMVTLLDDTPRVPLIRRFFAGGADSVRGYAFQTLGRLDSAGKPYGGDYLLEGSLELRFPLWKELGGVVFTDFGNVQDTAGDLAAPLRFAAGLGLRYSTPIGPLRLDIGYKLNPPGGTDSKDMYAVYLSIGQAF